MRYPDIEHHGAKDGVTGSRHQLHMDASYSLLIDCSLFQGNETSSDGRAATERLGIEFSSGSVQAFVVTLVHIVGRMPYLLAAGYKGPSYCGEPSAKLLPIVLEDAFKLGFSRDQKAVERYLKLVEQRLRPLPYQRWSTLLETEELIARMRLQRAGHILGSAYVEVDFTYPASGENRRIVFSGDLGAAHAPLLMPLESPERADILVLENTYGDRLHEDPVLIPAFSIGRTQELLYELEEIIHSELQTSTGHSVLRTDEQASKNVENTDNPHAQSPLPPGERAWVRGNSHNVQGHLETNWPKLPVILDSPSAARFTEAFRSPQPHWNQEARERVECGRNPLAFDNLFKIDSHTDHIAVVNHLTQTARPAVVIAGNGIFPRAYCQLPQNDARPQARCSIRWLPSPETTPGHVIQQHDPRRGYVHLDGERIDIRAGITRIGADVPPMRIRLSRVIE